MSRTPAFAIGLIAVLVATLFARLATAQDKPRAPAIVWADVTEKAGLVKPLAGMMGHGGAWGDYDGDGRIDLFVGNFCDRPDDQYFPAKGPLANRLFRNLGDGRFVSAGQASVEVYGRTSGAVFADLDNNDTLELYVANNRKAKVGREGEPQATAQKQFSNLYRNEGGQLLDISNQSGACPTALHTARNIGVFDYDQDGRLDLFVCEDYFTRSPRSALFRNLGNLKFQDVTESTGLPDDIYGLGLAVADLNGDRRPDFFVGHCNRLFLSQTDGRYREATELRETFRWSPLHNEDWPCGAAFGDLNRDGQFDLVISIHCTQARNKVYLNEGLKNGVPQFHDITREAGLADVVPARCPHVEIQDFDNDGWPDIYISAAWLDADDRVTPLVFHHDGVRDGLPRFTPPRPIGSPMVYYPAGPSGDYDADGRIDLFLINWFSGNHSRLMRNESSPRHWLDVRVAGREINRQGIGSQVRVYQAGDDFQPKALLGYQELSTGYGYASGQPVVCHFGLGDATKVDLRVELPNGKVVKQTNVAVDRALTIEEPK